VVQPPLDRKVTVKPKKEDGSQDNADLFAARLIQPPAAEPRKQAAIFNDHSAALALAANFQLPLNRRRVRSSHFAGGKPGRVALAGNVVIATVANRAGASVAKRDCRLWAAAIHDVERSAVRPDERLRRRRPMMATGQCKRRRENKQNSHGVPLQTASILCGLQRLGNWRIGQLL
jgi:hypothetical protein